MGLIDTGALRMFLLSVVEDFRVIKARHPEKISTLQQYAADIKRDIDEAMKKLPTDGRIDEEVLWHLNM